MKLTVISLLLTIIHCERSIRNTAKNRSLIEKRSYEEIMCAISATSKTASFVTYIGGPDLLFTCNTPIIRKYACFKIPFMTAWLYWLYIINPVVQLRAGQVVINGILKQKYLLIIGVLQVNSRRRKWCFLVREVIKSCGRD